MKKKILEKAKIILFSTLKKYKSNVFRKKSSVYLSCLIQGDDSGKHIVKWLSLWDRWQLVLQVAELEVSPVGPDNTASGGTTQVTAVAHGVDKLRAQIVSNVVDVVLNEAAVLFGGGWCSGCCSSGWSSGCYWGWSND